jgi:hypothetical protein
VAHPTRGHTSHTFDIKEVHAVDLDRLTISYSDAAHAAPQIARVKVKVATPAARQLVHAMADSLTVHGDGKWESSVTLEKMAIWVGVLLRNLAAQRIDDLSASGLELTQLRAALEPLDTGPKRTVNKLMARALRQHNPNGQALARALVNTSYMVVESSTELYDDVEVEAMKSAARRVFDEVFKSQREVLQVVGIDVSDRGWLRIPAEEIIAAARARHPELVGARQPRLRAPRIDQIDWALLNPEPFGTARGRPKGDALGETMNGIGDALYPKASLLTAALILQCLTELSGLNLSVMLRTEPADLIYTGKSNGMLKLAKARNHTEDTLAVRTNSNSTLGGLIEALTGLTRFSRNWRAMQLVTDDRVPEVVNRIYIEHKKDPNTAEVITNQRLHHGWRQPVFDRHWPEGAPARDEVGLRFQALRRKALEHAVTASPRADVHGHSSKTRVHYLANVLPEHVLVRHATTAQDDIIDSALARFMEIDELTDGNELRLAAAVQSGQAMDVIASVCISGGNDPDQAAKPCSLGLAACFTCPNGYRTVDHVPGLLATVRFTEIIRDNDPEEWESGDASALHFYASESLKQFPTTVVDAVRTRVDLASYVVTIEALYMEFRR